MLLRGRHWEVMMMMSQLHNISRHCSYFKINLKVQVTTECPWKQLLQLWKTREFFTSLLSSFDWEREQRNFLFWPRRHFCSLELCKRCRNHPSVKEVQPANTKCSQVDRKSANSECININYSTNSEKNNQRV